MLPVLWRCRPLRLLPEDRSSALFTDVTAGADSGYRFRRQCICTVAVGTEEGLSGIGGAERPAAFVVPDSNAPAPCKMVPESITVRYSANP